MPEPHTTAGKIADLERRRNEAIHAGSQRAVDQTARQGQDDRARADRPVSRPGLVHRARRAGQASRHRVRRRGQPALRRRRGHRFRHRRRASGLRVQPGLHRVRRLARRGLRREDRQGDGPRAQDRLPDHRDQRRRRRADPGGRGRARPVRRDLLPQRDRIRGDPADLADHGPVRRRRRLLARHHRLHADGGANLAHVHHRARRHQDRDRRGGQLRGTRRRARAQHQVRRGALPGRRRGRLPRLRPRPALLPAVQQPGGAPALPPDTETRRGRRDQRRRRRARHAHPRFRRTSHTTCTR